MSKKKIILKNIDELIVENIRCRNMFNISDAQTYRCNINSISENTITAEATDWWSSIYWEFRNIKKNTNYTFSYILDASDVSYIPGIYIYGNVEDVQYINGISGKGEHSITFNSGNYDSLRIQFNLTTDTGITYNLVTVTEPQLVEGDKQPYRSHKKFDGVVEIITGRECLTNEYIDGDRVYVKEINFGKMINNSTQILSTGIPLDYNIKRVFFKGFYDGKSQYYSLPYFVGNTTYLNINTLVVESIYHIVYTSVGDIWANTELVVEIYYTKN